LKVHINHQLSPTDERKDAYPVLILEEAGFLLPLAVYHEHAYFLSGNFEFVHQVTKTGIIVQLKGKGGAVSGTGMILAQACEKPYLNLIHG